MYVSRLLVTPFLGFVALSHTLSSTCYTPQDADALSLTRLFKQRAAYDTSVKPVDPAHNEYDPERGDCWNLGYSKENKFKGTITYEGKVKGSVFKKPTDFGTLIYSDNHPSGISKYKGTFVGGKPNGEGTVTYPNGAQYKGKFVFVHGYLQGSGTLIDSESNVKDGEPTERASVRTTPADPSSPILETVKLVAPKGHKGQIMISNLRGAGVSVGNKATDAAISYATMGGKFLYGTGEFVVYAPYRLVTSVNRLVRSNHDSEANPKRSGRNPLGIIAMVAVCAVVLVIILAKASGGASPGEGYPDQDPSLPYSQAPAAIPTASAA